MPEKTGDVIVIGGGITGCSAAYFLSGRGQRVLLFEKDSIAAHASGFAFGFLLPRLVNDSSDPANDLTFHALKLHRHLAAEMADEGYPGLRAEKATVQLARDENEAELFRTLYRSGDSLVGDTRWLEYGELSHIEARIAPEIPGGLYMGEAAEIDPPQFSAALWGIAEQRGAKLVRKAVDSISETGSGVVEVSAGGDTYSAASVIVAAGPWSAQLIARTGALVPVEPLKGQIVRTRAPGPPMKVSLWWGLDYAGSKPNGMTWCGSTQENAGFDDSPTDAALQGILQSVCKFLPFMESAEIVGQTACLRPVMPDGFPVIGRLSSTSNVIVATGGGRNGLVLGPALGKIAGEIVTGETSTIDVSLLGPARFNR